jgi:hypothetical protein
MNLAQAYSLANSKSGFARPDGEIYDALNQGGQRVFFATVKEFRGFFLKFDEVSLTLSPTQTGQEYTLPADCSQIVHIAERLSASEDWHPMAPEDLDGALTNLQNATGWDSFYSSLYGGESEFGYYGPYLDSTNTQNVGAALQLQKIRVSPIPQQTRFVQLAYTAKWLPIVDASSKIMLPDEGTVAMLNYATATLCGASDDESRAAYYEAQGDKHLAAYLTWARARQIQAALQVDTYGPGL